ncbi:zinc finger and BTB domain-containing protein 24 isoform X2 [Amyelois transitella]|uniref:zinc finger and BTB domain-containing protein 24 isoform X2 n=1 Tax=Amyelois transitella TaxID=680683 RepID=UPI00298F6C4B|nr:zinc finger and BTB domain-containing protein 24 isoform X2 [Amyelois transitella]
MNEIDINIEGFNVNGICVGCLNYNRKMYSDSRINDCFKLLGKIEVPDCLYIQVCWECLAAVRTVHNFQKQIVKSFEILHDYSRKHMFLDNPSDLSQHAKTRFSVSQMEIEPTLCAPMPAKIEIKIEPQYVEDIDDFSAQVKSEDKNDSYQEDDSTIDNNSIDMTVEDASMDHQPSSDDDDVILSQLKEMKKTVKVKKDVKPNKGRKLKNLPEDLVEVYTMGEEEMWSVRRGDVSGEEFQSVKYKCDDCIMGFLSAKLRDAHAARHQPKGDNSIQCDVCKTYFLTKDNFLAHRKHHASAYRCRRCGFRSTAKRIMAKHVTSHDVTCYKCDECDARFHTRSKLTYHKSVCSRERPQCDCCGKVFANKMTLKYHLKANKTTNRPKEKVYIPCKGCNKIFHSKKSYKAHSLKKMSESKPSKRGSTWDEESLRRAMEAVQNNQLSANAAALKFNIPRRTLRNHLSSGNSSKIIGKTTILTKQLEEDLSQQIQRFAELGIPLTPEFIRKQAFIFCETFKIKHSFNMSTRMAGRKWLRMFLSRNPINIQKKTSANEPC